MACSCTSFLNVEQIGKNTIEGFFAAPDGLKSAGIGLHKALLKFYDDVYVVMGELQGDNVELVRVNASEMYSLVFDFESLPAHDAGLPYNAWNKGYNVITNANQIIKHAPILLEKYPEQKELCNTEMGYAYFIRAVATFDLCNIYAQAYDFTADASHLGVVPVYQIPGFEDKLPRKSVKECYKMVVDDLLKSLEYFGNDNVPNVYYASGLAAEAMLARVYLYMKDYENAAKYAKIVMDKVPLADHDIYYNMFRKAKDYPGEAIMRFNTYDAGTALKARCNPISSADMMPADHFIASFADNDVRKELFTYTAEEEDGEDYKGKTYKAICKYLPIKHDVSPDEQRRCDFFLLRASEMYFIHAEALCLGPNPDLATAAADVKAVMARAIGADPSAITLAYGNAQELDAIIERERAKELCFEGHRFFDLKRRHKDVVRPDYVDTHMHKLTYPDYRYAQPIPHMEMQANKEMVQNDGYETE